MESSEFVTLRKKLKKTQKQMAQLLGKSIKAVHSYEQGWRTIPPDVERQMLFLLSRSYGGQQKRKPCWTVMKCPPDRKKQCPAWEFKAGKECWFISGTICEGEAKETWEEKLKICRSCEVLMPLLSADPS
ncbi:MAG: helix-turn-helix transcriptional regulator [Desulfobacterales bacterium]|nr:helix-turn-helix transcriptional regulator [Desulfobacterales bacterium]